MKLNKIFKECLSKVDPKVRKKVRENINKSINRMKDYTIYVMEEIAKK